MYFLLYWKWCWPCSNAHEMVACTNVSFIATIASILHNLMCNCVQLVTIGLLKIRLWLNKICSGRAGLFVQLLTSRCDLYN